MQLDATAVFGAEADRYDALRPGYPVEVVRGALAAVPAGGAALDIGCGTGKLAVVLRALGLAVTGLEPDRRMARHATAKGIPTEVAAFEGWDPAGRTFDLVASAQAWHWLAPVRRSTKAFQLLRPAGHLLLVWNLGHHATHVEEELIDAYANVLAGEFDESDESDVGQSPTDTDLFAAELSEAGFVDIACSHAIWSQLYTAAEWCQLLTTESWHLALPSDRRTALLVAVEELINRRWAGSIKIEYDCTTLTGVRQ